MPDITKNNDQNNMVEVERQVSEHVQGAAVVTKESRNDQHDSSIWWHGPTWWAIILAAIIGILAKKGTNKSSVNQVMNSSLGGKQIGGDEYSSLGGNSKKTNKGHQGSMIKGSVKQQMINSPGGLQVGGNYTVVTNPQVIQSIELHLALTTETRSTQITQPATSMGLQSVIACFTCHNIRIRFVSDWRIEVQQVTPTQHEVRFKYLLETPTQLQGLPIEALQEIDKLAVDFSDILNTLNIDTSIGNAILTVGVFLNGIPIAKVTGNIAPASLLKGGQLVQEVDKTFSAIPLAYKSAIAKTP